MAIVKVFSSPVSVQHRTHVCSKALFIRLFATLIIFIAPLLIAFASGGFWQRQDEYLEKPDVEFNHKLLVVVDTSTSGSYVTYSTYPNYNQLQMDNYRNMLVKSREKDIDYDGLNDVLDLQVEVPLLDTETVLGVQLLVFFDYKLNKYSPLRMESMANIEYQSAISGAAFTVTGDLMLYQTELLGHKGLDDRYNVPIIQNNSVYAEAFELPAIFNSYSSRNVTTIYSNQYPVWSPQRATGKPFVIKATVNYPEQSVHFEPGLWQIFKMALIQYVAIYIILAFLVNSILDYVYTSQKVSTRVSYPWNKLKRQ